MKKIILTATAMASVATLTPVVEVEAKDTLGSLTDAVNIATETLNNLQAQKERLEAKYKEINDRMEILHAGYDISDKDKLLSEIEGFLANESEKAKKLMEYNSYASNIEAETENTANQIVEQEKLISKLESDAILAGEAVEGATSALEDYYSEHEGIREKVEDEAGYATGMKHFVSKVAPEMEWKEEYPEYTPEEMANIFEGYKTLEKKQPLSLLETLKKSEALGEGDAYNATFLEDGRVFFGYANMDKADPEELDKKYEQYLKDKETLTKELDETEGLREKQNALAEANKTVEELNAQVEEAKEGKKEIVNKMALLANIGEEIEKLKETMASDAEIHEATLVQEVLKDATKESLLSTNFGPIENPVSDFGRRYNALVEEGRTIYQTNEGLVVDYNDYAKKLSVIDTQIESATKAKKEAEDRLEAYKKQLGISEETVEKTPVRNENNQVQAQDKGLETGIGGMSILIPVGAGVVGIAGLAIAHGLKHKKKRN